MLLEAVLRAAILGTEVIGHGDFKNEHHFELTCLYVPHWKAMEPERPILVTSPILDGIGQNSHMLCRKIGKQHLA